MKHTLDYIIRSWVFNLDVEPYPIDIETATEYAAYITPEDTDDTVTPEAVMEKWTRILN